MIIHDSLELTWQFDSTFYILWSSLLLFLYCDRNYNNIHLALYIVCLSHILLYYWINKIFFLFLLLSYRRKLNNKMCIPLGVSGNGGNTILLWNFCASKVFRWSCRSKRVRFFYKFDLRAFLKPFETRIERKEGRESKFLRLFFVTKGRSWKISKFPCKKDDLPSNYLNLQSGTFPW